MAYIRILGFAILMIVVNMGAASADAPEPQPQKRLACSVQCLLSDGSFASFTGDVSGVKLQTQLSNTLRSTCQMVTGTVMSLDCKDVVKGPTP